MARFAHVEWDAVTFAPGSLYAAGYLNGTSTPVAEQWVNTTGAPAALRISIKDGVGSTLYAGCADAGALQQRAGRCSCLPLQPHAPTTAAAFCVLVLCSRRPG